MGSGSDKEVVLVTGGTGFIASWMIKRLLDEGYSVRTTVRSSLPDDKKDLSFLTNLPGASDRLHIFEADLNEPHSFEPAIDGCIGVFHLAHAMDIIDVEPEAVATERAVNATLTILEACVKSKTIKRVVYTSSIVAVPFNDTDQYKIVVDESSWTDVDYYRSLGFTGTNYVASKTMSEKAALEFAEKNGLDLVTVIPPLVVGPFTTPHAPISVHMVLSMFFGRHEQYKYIMISDMVHIDDLVSAHIFLLTHRGAKGRYICSSNRLTLLEMSDFLSSKYPQCHIPTKDALKDIDGYKQHSCLSSTKLIESGFKFKYGLDEMFDGALQSCKERGFSIPGL